MDCLTRFDIVVKQEYEFALTFGVTYHKLGYKRDIWKVSLLLKGVTILTKLNYFER